VCVCLCVCVCVCVVCVVVCVFMLPCVCVCGVCVCEGVCCVVCVGCVYMCAGEEDAHWHYEAELRSGVDVTDFHLRYSLPVLDCFSATQTREGRHLEQNTLLKEEIRKLSRDRSVRVVFLLNRNF